MGVSLAEVRAEGGTDCGGFVDGWLPDDAQLSEDVPADGAAPVHRAGSHSVVATPGAEPKEAAGRRRTILGRRAVRRGAVVAGFGQP